MAELGSSSEEEQEVIIRRPSRSRGRTALAPAPAPAAVAIHQNYEALSRDNLRILMQLRGVPRAVGMEKSDLIEQLRDAEQTREGALKAAEFPASRFDNDTGETVSETRTRGAHAVDSLLKFYEGLRGTSVLTAWPAGSGQAVVGDYTSKTLPTVMNFDESIVRSRLTKDLERPAAWHDAKDYFADGAVHLVEWLGQESDGVSRIVLPRAESLLRKIEALVEPVVVETKDVACGRCDHCLLFARTFPGHVGTLAEQASNVKKPSKINWKAKKKGAGFRATFTCTADPRAQERLSDDTIRDSKFNASCKAAALLCRNFLVEVVAALDATQLQEYAEAAIELKQSHQYLGDCVRDASTYAKTAAARKKADRRRRFTSVNHSEINDNTIPMRMARDAEGVFEPTSDDLLAWGKR